jgi:lipopolysaccharide export system permease protein
MLRIKRLDIFIVRSFILLFVGTFFICLFIFMMQFLWRYVDDLVGKGLEMTVMAQFFFYSALSLVPAALPLAILLASLITFGNFGERYELLAMKAAGISLVKIMRPLMVLVFFISCISFYFQNVIGPAAQQELGTLLISVKQKSPELDIPEGAFYSEIPDYNIRIMKKNRETGMMYDVLIYNLQDGADNAHIIYSDSAKMEMTADKQHLNLHLYSGELFENLRSQNVRSENVPYRRESFKEKHSLIEFDSDFNMADASIMSNQATTKSMAALTQSIDSMTLIGDSIGRVYYSDLKRNTYTASYGLSPNDSVKLRSSKAVKYDIDSLYNTSSLQQKKRALTNASNRAETIHNDIGFKKYTMETNDYQIRRHEIEWHKKITISLSCLLFFFIGAPLGGIIRKGGLGMPVIISVLIFIIYYVIDTSGYKMARDGRWIVWMGVWLSSSILAPLGAWLTYKSNKDSVVLNIDAYVNWFKKVAGIRDVRHIMKKEVIINDPDYLTAPARLEELSATCAAYAAKNRLTKAPNYFTLWFHTGHDEDIVELHTRLESIIEELGNTHSARLINLLNNYPIISTTAHLRPFRRYWLNVVAAIVVPVGLFFYFRIWMFRIRLSKDMKRIAENNLRVIEEISRGRDL